MTRAKYAISFFNPVHGSVPALPMPILFVAATIRVSSRAGMVTLVSEVLIVSFGSLGVVAGKWE